MTSEQERTPREQFNIDFVDGLQEGGEDGLQKMVTASRRVGVELTEIRDNWGERGDGNYEGLLAQVTAIRESYERSGRREARGIIYLNDGGISRLQIYYDGKSLVVQPTKESSRRVRDNWAK